MANPYLVNFSVRNHRALRRFSVRNLGKVNVVGGLNGCGKSTFLESMFLFMDRRNPILLLRSFGWRNITPALGSAVRLSSTDGDVVQPMIFTATTRDGEQRLELKYEEQPLPQMEKIGEEEKSRQLGLWESSANRMGVTARATTGKKVEQELHIYGDLAGQIAAMHSVQPSSAIPTATMLNPQTLGNTSDLAHRFTFALERNLRGQLIKFLRLVIPGLKNLETRYVGEAPVLYGALESGLELPVAMLGAGAHALLSIALAILGAPDGVLFVDEFDSAIHYSLMEEAWSQLHKLATQENCQLFLTTHSKEFIQSAVTALEKADALNDLRYIRLDRIEGEVTPEEYTHGEISKALEAGWEVR